VSAVATHGVLPGDSLHNLLGSGLFSEIVCTDSHPRAVELADEPNFTVVSIAELLADFLAGRPTASLPD
jgi:ribose-phosphate pyrophosphokinase